MVTKKPRQTPEDEVLEFARETAKHTPNWMTLHNALFGIGGKCEQLFPGQRARALFVETPQYKAINALIESLCDQNPPSGNINVRLPKSVHAALQAESEREGISINTLIISKVTLNMNAQLAGSR